MMVPKDMHMLVIKYKGSHKYIQRKIISSGQKPKNKKTYGLTWGVSKSNTNRNVCFEHSFTQRLVSTLQMPFWEYSLEHSRARMSSLSDHKGRNSKAMVSGPHKGMEANIHRTLSCLYFCNPFPSFHSLPAPLPVAHHRKQGKLFIW